MLTWDKSVEFGYSLIVTLNLANETTLDNMFPNFQPLLLEDVIFLVKGVKKRSKRG